MSPTPRFDLADKMGRTRLKKPSPIYQALSEMRKARYVQEHLTRTLLGKKAQDAVQK